MPFLFNVYICRTDESIWKGQNRRTKKVGHFPVNLVDLPGSKGSKYTLIFNVVGKKSDLNESKFVAVQCKPR